MSGGSPFCRVASGGPLRPDEVAALVTVLVRLTGRRPADERHRAAPTARWRPAATVAARSWQRRGDGWGDTGVAA